MKDRISLSPELRRRVAEARVARLATVRPDGRPHLVPITFVLDGDTIFTALDHKPKTTANLQRLRNIAAHPVAGVIVDHYEEDWSKLWWIRADGDARIVTEGETYERSIQLLAGKYAPYREHPLQGAVIIVDVDRWSVWSAG